jgi:methylated-DNA-[protein]-cysteine S-methyltransferase
MAGRQSLVTAFPTELRWMAIAWRDDVIQRVTFGQSSRRQAELAITRPLSADDNVRSRVVETQSDEVPPFVSELIEELTRFAEGEPVDFSHVALDLEHLTPFALRVVKACRRISWGKTRSYGELAQLCGAPGAARAVGSVMAKNRFPLIVPCHRVLGAGGALGGYSAPDGLDMKRRLLAAEDK